MQLKSHLVCLLSPAERSPELEAYRVFAVTVVTNQSELEHVLRTLAVHQFLQTLG